MREMRQMVKGCYRISAGTKFVQMHQAGAKRWVVAIRDTETSDLIRFHPYEMGSLREARMEAERILDEMEG